MPVPRKTGRYLFCNYPLEELVPLVNWSYFFSAWGLPGRYPALFDDPKRGEEARRVFDDAQRLLSEIVDRRLLRADGVIGFIRPHRTGTISCCTPTNRGNGSG